MGKTIGSEGGIEVDGFKFSELKSSTRLDSSVMTGTGSIIGASTTGVVSLRSSPIAASSEIKTGSIGGGELG